MAQFNDEFSVRPHILRLTVTQGTQNIVGNYTDVNWNLRIYRAASWKPYGSDGSWSVNIHGNGYSGSFSYNFNNYTELLLASGTTRIYHNADGTATISVSSSAYIGSAGGSASAGGSMSLTTIPRASTPTFSASPIDAGQTVTITTNRASSSFTHDITYSIGSLVDQPIATGVGTSVGWAIPMSILNQMTEAVQAPVSIKTVTKNGSTVIGTTTVNLQVKAPTSVVPDFTTITHSEATAGLAANVGAYVQGLSKLNLAITGAVGAYGSTITSYQITVAGQTVNAVSGVTPNPLGNSGTVNIQATITDSRGRTRTKTVGITVLAYLPPQLNDVTVERALSSGVPDPDDGTYVRVNIDAQVQSLIVGGIQKNALTYTIFSRLRGVSGWTLKASDIPGGVSVDTYELISTYALGMSYDILIEVSDDFATTSIQLTISVAQTFMHWDGVLGVGIGKRRENGVLDVAGDVFIRNGEEVVSFPDLDAEIDALEPIYNNGYRLKQVLKYTANGTFTKASYPWLRAIRVKVQGGGGAGGGSVATGSGVNSEGGGGGGGGYAESFITNIAGLASSVAVTVGAGGTGVTGGGGNSGGTSSFGTAVVATGGSGGGAKSASAVAGFGVSGGSGGEGTAGDLLIFGGGGQAGIGSATIGIGGAGGNSFLGGGAWGQASGATGGGGNGPAGENYGGGGGGALGNQSSSARAGGAGAPGIVIVELYA